MQLCGLRGIALVATATGVLWSSQALASADVITLSTVAVGPTEGQQYAGPLATFIDFPGGDVASDYTATIAWGDGVTSPATVSGSDVAGWTVSTSGHTYQEEGTYTLAVTVDDTAAPTSATLTEPIAVQDAPLSPAVAAPQTFGGTGPSGTKASQAAFEAAIGGTVNSAPSEQTGGLRVLTWDGVHTDGTDTLGATPIDTHVVSLSPSRIQPFGLRPAGPLAVAGDGFVSVNSGVTGKFAAFSPPNVAAPYNSNILELGIVAPTATTEVALPQATRGVGLVFLNVAAVNVTSVSYYDGQTLLGRSFAPAGGFGTTSFLGELFGAPVVTRVVVALGTSMIFGWDGATTTPGPHDGLEANLVALDDVVLAEPAPERPRLSTTVGVPLSGVLDTFSDADPLAAAHDYTAQVDWGDGSLSDATVAGTGPFTIGGGHTYTSAGSFTALLTISDHGGAQRSVRVPVIVAPTPVAAPPSTPNGGGSTAPSKLAPRCSIAAPGKQLARRARVFAVTVTCDLATSANLTATATVSPKGSHAHTRLDCGTAHVSLAAGNAATLTLRPPARTLSRIRRAARKGARIALTFSLAATNAAATSTASESLASLKVAR